MNDTIRKLALQTDAWCDQNCFEHPLYNVQWEQKFAELIVRECVDILNSPGAMKVDESTLSEFSEYSQGWVNGRKLGIDHLKEHFGV